MHAGSCLCGAVRFSVDGPLSDPVACHCSMCRKVTGHFLVSTEVKTSSLHLAPSDQLCWFQSSGKVRRGFCATCGSTLFFDAIFRDWTAVAMGAFDAPTGARMALHIYVADKGDYYDIMDGLPQNAQ